MRNGRKVFWNNSILILLIVIICISVPITYLYFDRIIFNTIIVKDIDKEYNPTPNITIVLQANGDDIELSFSHLREPSDDFMNVLYVYKDAEENEYFIDAEKGYLLAVNFIADKAEISEENIATNEVLKEKAEKFLIGIVNLEKYEFDGDNSILYSDNIVLSWSKHSNKISTSDGIVLTMYKDGDIKSLVFKNKGFYEKNITEMPIIVDDYSDELIAEEEGSKFLLNSINNLHGANIKTYTKKYSKLVIDTDLKLYWIFVFDIDLAFEDILNGVESIHTVKVDAFTNEASYKLNQVLSTG